MYGLNTDQTWRVKRFEEYGLKYPTGEIIAKAVLTDCLEVDDKFRKKVNLSDNGETFIFNAQPLNPNLTVAKFGLAEWSMIYVIRNNGIRGG